MTRDVVRHYGGLEPLCKLLQFTENKQLLAAATGGIWKCSYNLENVLRYIPNYTKSYQFFYPEKFQHLQKGLTAQAQD